MRTTGSRSAQATWRAGQMSSPPKLLFGVVGAAGVVALVIAAALLSRSPVAALVLFAVCAFLIGLQGHLLALTAGPICWMVLNGFVAGRYGELHWHGATDALRLAVLTAVGIAGGATGALASRVRCMTNRARAMSAHVVASGRHSQPWEPDLPAPEDTWFWN